MKKKVLSLLMVVGAVAFAYPQTLTCSCGSQAAGRTIEYKIINTGGPVDCCRGTAVGTNNAYSFTWAPAGHNTYVLTSESVYPTSAAAQRDCCQDAA